MMACLACHRLTLKSVYDMCTGQPVASRQALVASSMACCSLLQDDSEVCL